jgi:hypothetical protein
MPKRKVFGLAARKPDLTPQEFHDHYRHPHGTMGLSISTLRDYVQSHQIATDLLDDTQYRFEIIAELTFDNSEDIVNLRSEPMMNAFHNADEWRFIDMRASATFVGEEEVLQSTPIFDNEAEPRARWRHFSRPNSIKLMQFAKPEAGEDWYGDEDVALGRRLNAYRQVRWHPSTPVSLDPKRTVSQFRGVREFWWPTLTVLNRAATADKDAWHALVDRPHVHNVVVMAEWFR